VGRIAAGFATSHVVFSPDGVTAQADRIWDGMQEIGKRVRAAQPDVLILAGNDHLNNFNLSLQAPFIVGIADEYTPLGDMGVPRMSFPGHREFAEQFVRFSADRGFDLARAEEVEPDHGLAIPHTIIDPSGEIPVVPVYLNAAIDPIPSPARCWALGETLKEMVESVRPADEKIVVVATGGLSHWLCDPEEGRVNETFDRDIISKLISGKGRELSQLDQETILREGGNGGLEIISWIFMAACLPGARGEQIYYEPVPEWITGMAGIALTGE
jgi:protocatechuate 4,5-dioxygenase beta chain/2'-aminobiphenyl-2,3-diol 1,2-dioxygenase large subunit